MSVEANKNRIVARLAFLKERIKTETYDLIIKSYENQRDFLLVELQKLTNISPFLEKNMDIIEIANKVNQDTLSKMSKELQRLDAEQIPVAMLVRFSKNEYALEAEKRRISEEQIIELNSNIMKIMDYIYGNNQKVDSEKELSIETSEVLIGDVSYPKCQIV